MEKALKFLKHMKQTDTPYNFRECEINEAITELKEAMKPKTCEGCKHIVLGINSCGSTMDCKKGFKCSRVFKDEFELKDNK